MICPHIRMPVCKYAYVYMRPYIRITDHVSVCGVLISSGSMFSKTAVTVIQQAFSYDFPQKQTQFGRFFNIPWMPMGICHGCQIVHSDPLNRKTSYPKK